jgi:hypothetical protein
LAEKQTELSNAVDKSPPQKYLEAMEALMKWVQSVEGVLLSEHAVVADTAVMEDQLQKFKVSHLDSPLNSIHFLDVPYLLTGQLEHRKLLICLNAFYISVSISFSHCKFCSF